MQIIFQNLAKTLKRNKSLEMKIKEEAASLQTSLFTLTFISLALTAPCFGQSAVFEDLLDTTSCYSPIDIPNNLIIPGLTPFWAQEYVGADLVQEDIKLISNLKNVLFGDIDTGFHQELMLGPKLRNIDIDQESLGEPLIHWEGVTLENPRYSHALKTVNLINAPYPIGSSPVAVLAVAMNSPRSDLSEVKKWAKQAPGRMAKKGVELVNFEKHTLDILDPDRNLNHRYFQEVFKKMSEASIFIGAAGNNYPFPKNPKPSGLNLIIIGSLEPEGWMSFFSSESEEVTISAPSGMEQLSWGHEGLTKYGGTSGATPLVTGALANALSLLSNLTIKEAKTLILKTSIPTSNSWERPQKNGVGMLNSYKLFKVAERLKQLGWPKNRGDILNQESIYDFKTLAGEELDLANEQFQRAMTCQDRHKALGHLRRAWLLDFNLQTTQILAKKYAASSLFRNAEFYRNFDREELKKSLSKILLSRSEDFAGIDLETFETTGIPFTVDYTKASHYLSAQRMAKKLEGR